jgi:hypothetical protein
MGGNLSLAGSSELEPEFQAIARSRRVEFKILTDAETRLAKILEALQ